MIPYEQLEEALSRWQAEKRAAETGGDAGAEPTDHQPADAPIAEAETLTEADVEAETVTEADEIVEPEPE